MPADETTHLTDFVPDEPGIEDSHAEHLPNGDFLPPVVAPPLAAAQGDISGELPPERHDAGVMGALGLTDVD